MGACAKKQTNRVFIFGWLAIARGNSHAWNGKNTFPLYAQHKRSSARLSILFFFTRYHAQRMNDDDDDTAGNEPHCERYMGITFSAREVIELLGWHDVDWIRVAQEIDEIDAGSRAQMAMGDAVWTDDM